MIQTSRRDLAIASICAAAAILLAASSAAATAIPPPESGIDLTPHPALTAVTPAADATAATESSSATEQQADSSPSAPRIVQVERSWIETWAVGGRNPLAEAEPPRKQMAKPRTKRCDKAWPEIGMILKGYDALIEFYETQGRETEAEQTLKDWIDVCTKIAELRMLAESDGPGAAMREYYRYIHRPDRAVKLDLRSMEKEIDRLERARAEVEARIARLSREHESLDRKLHELNARRERRMAELEELQEAATLNDDGQEGDEPANDPAPSKERRRRSAASAVLQSVSLRLVTMLFS